MAIDGAFGRWDLTHLRRFTLADGTEVSDPESMDDLVGAPFGPIPKTKPLTARVGRTLRDGDRFDYVFDFGDDWTHHCVVEGRADPPHPGDEPVITWGWGSLPDQYGRRWADDDGRSDAPPRDAALPRHDQQKPDPIDLRAFRIAVHQADPASLVETITGVEIDHALQQIGAGMLRVQLGTTGSRRTVLEPYLLSLHQRLSGRRWAGDTELAGLILAVLQKSPPDLLRVDLDEMISDPSSDDGHLLGYLNVETGEFAPPSLTDEFTVGADVAVDVTADAWIELYEDPTDERWQDMAEFAASQESAVRAMLEQAIQGKGAFTRFRDAVHRGGLHGRWTVFSDDRRIGRLRVALAQHGVKPI